MLLLTLLGGTRRWTWLTTNRPLRFLGFISYGLYLIHVLVFWLVQTSSAASLRRRCCHATITSGS